MQSKTLREALLRHYLQPPKPRIFVSYHHTNDQLWYDAFTKLFDSTYDLFTDTSLERKVDSDDSDYVRRFIREQNITGSSMTIVLCGSGTWKRRWVDWEIQMTLNKQHALLGIMLPMCARNLVGQCIVPGRLADNIESGYACWMWWPENLSNLSLAINMAREWARWTTNINNSRPAMKRSLS